MAVYAVIMAGGSGTRLWPLSRANFPKFLLRPTGRESLLEVAIRRGRKVADEIRVVCGERHVRPILDNTPSLKKSHLIIEPCARSTAPCIGLATVRILKGDPSAVLVVLPADQHIEDEKAFCSTLRRAAAYAEKNDLLVTVGIVPSFPATGYGYIESGPQAGNGVFRVRRFVEKPDARTARRYLASGRFFWNAGIFVGKAGVFLEEIRRHMPSLHRGLEKIRRGGSLERIYRTLPALSIDYGVMEKSDRLALVPGRFGWRDVGDLMEWAALSGRKEGSNLICGDGLALESENLVIHSEGRRIVAALGVRNLIIAATDDAVLVVDRKRVQEVRKVTEALRGRGER